MGGSYSHHYWNWNPAGCCWAVKSDVSAYELMLRKHTQKKWKKAFKRLQFTKRAQWDDATRWWMGKQKHYSKETSEREKITIHQTINTPHGLWSEENICKSRKKTKRYSVWEEDEDEMRWEEKKKRRGKSLRCGDISRARLSSNRRALGLGGIN